MKDPILNGRIIFSCDVPPGYAWPDNGQKLNVVFNQVDKKLYKMPLEAKAERRSKILIFGIDFTPTLQNLNDFIQSYSKHYTFGDVCDMYCLADLAHEEGKDNELMTVLKNLTFAPGSMLLKGKIADTAFMCNHASSDCGLRAGVKDFNNYWNPNWQIIVHQGI